MLLSMLPLANSDTTIDATISDVLLSMLSLANSDTTIDATIVDATVDAAIDAITR